MQLDAALAAIPVSVFSVRVFGRSFDTPSIHFVSTSISFLVVASLLVAGAAAFSTGIQNFLQNTLLLLFFSYG